MHVQVIKKSMSREQLAEIAKEGFGDVVKAVVDVDQKIMAIGGELHADEEVALMEKENSRREHTWGINIYPEKPREEWIEFDSMVNLKPVSGNRSRDIEDRDIRNKIQDIVNALVTD